MWLPLPWLLTPAAIDEINALRRSLSSTLGATPAAEGEAASALQLRLMRLSVATRPPLSASQAAAALAAAAGARPPAHASPAHTPTDLLLVAVSRGQQPTPGYGFELLEGTLKGDAVTVRLGWNRPAADAVLAQVITHPCIVIGLEGEGFGTLRVLDEEGALLGEIVLAGG